MMRWLLSLLLLNWVASAQDMVEVGPFVDTDTCYGSLLAADCCPANDLIDREEYVTFVQLFGPDGFLADVSTFDQLPVVLKLNFNALACLCSRQPGASDDCCVGDNANINITGVAQGEVSPYLFSVCLFTDTSIERVLTSTAPSVMPTAMPSYAPSVTPGSPTIAPTATEAPTSTPAPTMLTTPDTQIVMVPYPIAVTDGMVTPIDPSSYENDLIAAMDIVATNVALRDFRRRLLRSRRRLTVMARTPTTISGTILIPCPPGVPENDECREVNPVIVIELVDEEDPELVRDEYEAALTEAIFVDGDLQTALTVVNPNSPVRILSPVTPAPTPSPDDGGISGGGIAGIVIAAAVVSIAGVGYFVFRRKREQDKDRPYFPSDDDKARDAAVLGAGSASYGKGKRDSDRDVAAASAGKKADDSSSNAGSSGWSSSAGVSSLNSEHSETKAQGSTLAAMGVASARSAKKIESGDVPDLPTVTRADLDTAIDSGDWAAVGATAALLAAASDSQSHSSKSRKSGTSASKGGSTVSSIDAARAAELDHLVDAGDWEGVVLAAARFEKSEGDSSTSKSESGSKNSESQSGSATRSGTAGSSEYYTGSRTGSGSYGTSSGYSQGETTSLSDSPSKQAKRAEMRNEVEALVRRVVPDEIDNVDEMMLQFRGREEELVETLRTMQERSIAQRAKAADRKSAKIQARDDVRKARQGDTAGVAAGAVGDAGGGLSGGAVAGIAAGAAVGGATIGAAGAALASKSKKNDEAKDTPALKSEDEGETSDSERKKRRTALEEAIDAGDWEAVGEAAAMMSDASVTTASSRSFTASLDTDTSSRKKRTGVNAERAAELDSLIDKGDWTGVMAAAGNFSKTDREGKSLSSSSPDTSRDDGKSTGTGSGSGGSQRKSWFGRKKSDAPAGKGDDASAGSSKAKSKALKEEQDALAQAEVWMQIAEQSKAEGSTEEVGASDAADWAIARSLSALRHAEAGGELKGDSVRKPTEDEAASTGDKSV